MPTRKIAAGLLIGIGAAAIVLALARLGLLDTAELKLYDWRMPTRRRIARSPRARRRAFRALMTTSSFRR